MNSIHLTLILLLFSVPALACQGVSTSELSPDVEEELCAALDALNARDSKSALVRAQRGLALSRKEFDRKISHVFLARVQLSLSDYSAVRRSALAIYRSGAATLDERQRYLRIFVMTSRGIRDDLAQRDAVAYGDLYLFYWPQDHEVRRTVIESAYSTKDYERARVLAAEVIASPGMTPAAQLEQFRRIHAASCMQLNDAVCRTSLPANASDSASGTSMRASRVNVFDDPRAMRRLKELLVAETRKRGSARASERAEDAARTNYMLTMSTYEARLFWLEIQQMKEKRADKPLIVVHPTIDKAKSADWMFSAVLPPVERSDAPFPVCLAHEGAVVAVWLVHAGGELVADTVGVPADTDTGEAQPPCMAILERWEKALRVGNFFSN